ncbi:hypothetical protein AIOL_003651 [Candidatus Rhodobacter oscarellae]|uniref:FHA domain-containing protein n=2 Tax=Candidatus Rhodobacter oscarellae TaxID=1675527 RepID=A0A0J9E7J4_9RHOB|nr:hypothetical protein AIOL_003651 [Candidatus Rhodobacter lobularis]
MPAVEIGEHDRAAPDQFPVFDSPDDPDAAFEDARADPPPLVLTTPAEDPPPLVLTTPAEDPPQPQSTQDAFDAKRMMAQEALKMLKERAVSDVHEVEQGRQKTRLLGFGAAAPGEGDIFGNAAPEQATPSNAGVKFPVGWLVVTGGPGAGASFSLQEGAAQIGRGHDQAISLDFGDTAISRENHAAVAYDRELNAFYLGHGGKTNIVRLNNKPVLSTEELASGDEIRIGETTLRFVALCGEGFTWAPGQDHE